MSIFIVSPRIGLCNQLQTIVKGILLGIKFNRNIYIDKFQINLYNNDLWDINKILNINKTNDFLLSINVTNCKIINEIDKNIINNIANYKLPTINYNNIQEQTCINNHIEKNLDKNIIYLGNIVSLCLNKSFNYTWGDYSNLYYLIISNIKFHDNFYKIKEEIKTKLNLKNYTTIHLRIEDDALRHFSHCYKLTIDEYNQKLLSYYNSKIKVIKQNMYICSGIFKYDNKINYNYYINLKKNNNLIYDKSNVTIDNIYLNNRELIAIIEMLIAYDSDKFIGCGISSFSRCIENYFKCNKKNNIELFE